MLGLVGITLATTDQPGTRVYARCSPAGSRRSVVFAAGAEEVPAKGRSIGHQVGQPVRQIPIEVHDVRSPGGVGERVRSCGSQFEDTTDKFVGVEVGRAVGRHSAGQQVPAQDVGEEVVHRSACRPACA